MLLGHNWVTNGSYLHRQISYKSDIGGSDYTAQESAQKRVNFESKWAFNDVDKKSVTFGNSSGETTLKTTQKTNQKASHNIRVNNLHANCFQIVRKNQHLQMIVRGNRETEPQINADERRFVDRDFRQQSKYEKQQSPGLKPPALKQENKTRNSTRMIRIKRMSTDPCKSAPSAKSAFYRTDSRTKSTDRKVSAFICVHPLFFYDMTFERRDESYENCST